MFVFTFFNVFLLCYSLVDSESVEKFGNWIPLHYTERANENKIVAQTTENLWKQAEPSQNIDFIKNEAIQIVTPPVVHRRKGMTFYFSTPNINDDIDFLDFDLSGNQKYNESTKSSLLEKTSEYPEHVTSNASQVSDLFETPYNLGFNTSEDIKLPESPIIVLTNTNEFSQLSELPYNVKLKRNNILQSYNFTKGEKIDGTEVSKLSALPTNVKFNTSEVSPESVSETNHRRPKVIHSIFLKDDIENFSKNTSVDKINTAETSTYVVSVDRTYAVTEATTTTEGDETYPDKGYVYKQPLIIPLGLTSSRNRITNKFINTLSKYNIKMNDILNNYSASKTRVQNHENMFKDKFHLQIPSVISIPFRYNSLNHLPVNPLMAVFLSNYGYYLQGSFGRPNDYKNLYGYSASNNIHNNKPFGSYKQSSDTDANN